MTIIAAAVMVKGLIVSKTQPARHHHILNELAEILPDHFIQPDDQGFINHMGEFLSREDALIHAEEYKQEFTIHKIKNHFQLFSEDLW